MLAFHLATFTVDATPPEGHSLCGGWIKPVVGVDDPLSLRGVVLLGAGLPIVLAALDWTGVMDESHRLWTEALADAAHTTPDRVGPLRPPAQRPLHRPRGERPASPLRPAPLLYDEEFVDRLVQRSAAAVRESLTPAQPVSHIRAGQAEVKEVACNRRVIGADGKIQFTRYSATTDPAAPRRARGNH